MVKIVKTMGHICACVNMMWNGERSCVNMSEIYGCMVLKVRTRLHGTCHDKVVVLETSNHVAIVMS